MSNTEQPQPPAQPQQHAIPTYPPTPSGIIDPYGGPLPDPEEEAWAELEQELLDNRAADEAEAQEGDEGDEDDEDA